MYLSVCRHDAPTYVSCFLSSLFLSLLSLPCLLNSVLFSAVFCSFPPCSFMFFTYPNLILLNPKTSFSSPLLSTPSLKKKKKPAGRSSRPYNADLVFLSGTRVFPGGHFFFHSVASEICNPSLATTPIIEPLALCRPGNCQKTFTYRLRKPNRKQLELLLPVFMEGGLTENSPAEPVFFTGGQWKLPITGGVIKRVSTVEQKPTESECHRANYIYI